jgi:pimeloyl-ACP methyl ester carboxylesterase
MQSRARWASCDDRRHPLRRAAGSRQRGLAGRAAAERLQATVLPLPDEGDVLAIAASVEPAIADVPRPRAIVGTSLGAMVALELARRIDVDALVLVAAGFGISVADSVLDWVASDPPELLERMARTRRSQRSRARCDQKADLAARGQRVLVNHLRALATYRPQPLESPPPTVVIWGEFDRGVPLADHVQLALRCDGVLVPVAGAGHAPFLERPAETASWIQALCGATQPVRLTRTKAS